MKVRFYIISSIVVLLNLGFFLYFNFLRPRPGMHLVYGESFPQNSAVDFNGQSIEWKNRWALIIFFRHDSDLGIRNARYADILSRRYASQGLTVVAIVQGDRSHVRAVIETAGLSYPVIDSKENWEKRLALEEHSLGVFLIDPNGRIQFAATYVQPEDLRQLVEKHLLGTISYAPPDTTRALKVGERFPHAFLVDVRQGRRVNLEGLAERMIIIFTGRCPSCGLSSYLTSYRSFELLMRDSAQHPLLIFSSKFSEREIIESAAQLDLQDDLYLAPNGIPGIEDEYYLKSYFSDEVLVVTTDRTGTITSIQSLEEINNKRRPRQ